VPSKLVGDAPFAITPPTSNSTGAFSYTSSNAAVATISGNTITVVGAGTSTITANQAAAGSYTAGSTTALFTVTFGPPTVAAPTPPTRVAADVMNYYSSAYAEIPGTDWNPNWNQALTVQPNTRLRATTFGDPKFIINDKVDFKTLPCSEANK
jgi:hypothetical protein